MTRAGPTSPRPNPADTARGGAAWADVLKPIRAVLFDLDGTLYWQPPLRVCMALELGAWSVVSGRGFSTTSPAGVIAVFRRTREALREFGPENTSLDSLQFEEAARRLGCPENQVRRIVAEWMFERPLKYLRLCRRRGLEQLLAFLDSNRFQAGVLSDYPPQEKLQALGLRERFSLALCATDDGVNAFKPHPAGFELACRRWGLEAKQVLYVGDRPDVDAVGARSAGMPCAILSSGRLTVRRSTAGSDYLPIRGFGELQRVLSRLI